MKKYIFPGLLIWIVSQHCYAQCGSVSVQSVSNFTPMPIDSLFESDGLRNGPNYDGATLYYPKNAGSGLRSIVLCPGFLGDQTDVNDWARYIASRGFIGMAIGSVNLWDAPNLRATALLDGMETVRQENNRAASPLYQKIDAGNIALGGHSMGAGGAQLAAKSDSRVKTVVALTPWLETSTLTAADLNHTQPVLIISSELDQTAPPAQYANVHYNYTPTSTPKLLFEILGGDHDNFPLDPKTGNGDVGNLIYAWLNLFLTNDSCYCGMLSVDSLDQHASSSKYLTNLNCAGLSVPEINSKDQKINISPNPAVSGLKIEFDSNAQMEYRLYDLLGKSVQSGKVHSGDVINIEELKSGIYFLKAGSKNIKLIKSDS